MRRYHRLICAYVKRALQVVAYMPGATILDAWIDHPNITAVVSPLQPGEQAGPALVSVLYGDVSPSGKLPFTIAKNIGDYPPDTLTNTTDINPQNDFTEGVNFDYRWFDVNNITPRYGSSRWSSTRSKSPFLIALPFYRIRLRTQLLQLHL